MKEKFEQFKKRTELRRQIEPDGYREADVFDMRDLRESFAPKDKLE